MPDAATLGLLIGAFLVALNLDCNRRVRELQKTTDRHTRWLDALMGGRRANDTDDPPPLRRRDPRR